MRIVFLCHFSNEEIRSRIKLKNWKVRNWIVKKLNHPVWKYVDKAVWVDDFVAEFKNHTNEHEFHIVSPHAGMKLRNQNIIIDKIHYHIYKNDNCLLNDFVRAKLSINERTNFSKVGRRAAEIIKEIQPDVICLCGAENPEYGSAVFYLNKIPVVLIPQTFLNDPKRIEMKVASAYRVSFEKEVISKVDCVSTDSQLMRNFVSNCNEKVTFVNIGFPSHHPPYYPDESKKFDFVFFANNITKFKGIEDVLAALVYIKQSHPYVSLEIIGNCEESYKSELMQFVCKHSLYDNVNFLGYFESRNEMYRHVQNARIAVLPGITAAINSTVRESMYLHMPTIVYHTSAIGDINKEKECICSATMEDVEDLSLKMRMLLDDTLLFKMYSDNGFLYASKFFDNSKIVNNLITTCQSIVKTKK